MNEFLHNMQCCLDEITAKELRQKLLEPTYVVKATPSSPIALNKISNMRVIFNDPATILIVGNKKYVSKAHDENLTRKKVCLCVLQKQAGTRTVILKSYLKLLNAKRKRNNYGRAFTTTI